MSDLLSHSLDMNLALPCARWRKRQLILCCAIKAEMKVVRMSWEPQRKGPDCCLELSVFLEEILELSCMDIPCPFPGWWKSMCKGVEVRERWHMVLTICGFVAEAQGRGMAKRCIGDWMGHCGEGA